MRLITTGIFIAAVATVSGCYGAPKAENAAAAKEAAPPAEGEKAEETAKPVEAEKKEAPAEKADAPEKAKPAEAKQEAPTPAEEAKQEKAAPSGEGTVVKTEDVREPRSTLDTSQTSRDREP